MYEKTGEVVSVNPEKCTARVRFDDQDELISDELQIGVKGSFKNKEYWMPKIGEQVFCSFTEQKKGYILFSVYSEEDKPPITDENKRHMSFEDGTTFEYDTKTHTLSIQCEGAIHIKALGKVIVDGDVIADGISLKGHTHMSPDGPTTSPVGGG